MTALERLHRWARLARHRLATNRVHAMLCSAAPGDFELVYLRWFELAYCPDPLECECLQAKPLRKLVSG